VLVINSADDERNPPELGIPGSPDTFGHGTTGNARFGKKKVAELMQSAPRLKR